MKARVLVTPKADVPDPEGRALRQALENMGYSGIASVRVGKTIEIEFAPGTDPATAQRTLEDAGHRFFRNASLEDYRIEYPDSGGH